MEPSEEQVAPCTQHSALLACPLTLTPVYAKPTTVPVLPAPALHSLSGPPAACAHTRQTVAELDYRHLFENGGVAQAIARLDGQFIACNTLFAELCGYATAACGAWFVAAPPPVPRTSVSLHISQAGCPDIIRIHVTDTPAPLCAF